MWLLNLDKKVTEYLYQDQLSGNAMRAVFAVAGYLIYSLPIVALVLFFRSGRDRLASIKLVLAAAFSWQVLSRFVGAISYGYYGFRERPFAERGIQELLFERPQKAFPSDHAAVFAAATVLCFGLGYRKLGWFFFAIGLASSIARVVIGFHWAGDILGGWLIGAIGASIVLFFGSQIDRAWLWIEQLFSKKRPVAGA